MLEDIDNFYTHLIVEYKDFNQSTRKYLSGT